MYTIEWEKEVELIFDNPIPYQGPNVIYSHGIIKNITPANLEDQKINDGQNLKIDPVIEHPTSQDVGRSTVTEQTSESHVKSNEVLVHPTESIDI